MVIQEQVGRVVRCCRTRHHPPVSLIALIIAAMCFVCVLRKWINESISSAAHVLTISRSPPVPLFCLSHLHHGHACTLHSTSIGMNESTHRFKAQEDFQQFDKIAKNAKGNTVHCPEMKSVLRVMAKKYHPDRGHMRKLFPKCMTIDPSVPTPHSLTLFDPSNSSPLAPCSPFIYFSFPTLDFH
jgi:hypothetical protein